MMLSSPEYFFKVNSERKEKYQNLAPITFPPRLTFITNPSPDRFFENKAKTDPGIKYLPIDNDSLIPTEKSCSAQVIVENSSLTINSLQ